MTPTLSIIIPTRNRAASLRTVLPILLADPAASEIVIVDDGSSDATPALLAEWTAAHPRVRAVRSEHAGAAAARQLGVEAAGGQIVLLLDDDVVPAASLSTGHLARHAAAAPDEAGSLVVVGGMPTVVSAEWTRGTFATRLYAREYDRHVERWARGELDILTSLWAGNVSLPRRLCLDVGVVSPEFPPTKHQDRDFGIRLAKHGARAVFDPALEAVHAHVRPLDAFLEDARRQGLGRYHLHRLHGDVLGPGSLEDTTADLAPWLRWVVRAGDRGWSGSVARAGARRAVQVAGLLRWARGEEHAAKVARRMMLRRGFLEASRA